MLAALRCGERCDCELKRGGLAGNRVLRVSGLSVATEVENACVPGGREAACLN